MQFTVESKTVSECIEYLMLEYHGKKYTLDKFSETFKEKEFQLESLLPECYIIYRDKVLSFDDYKKTRLQLSNELHVVQRYGKDIFPLEMNLAICNYDYYKAAKFLEKAEDCLQTARFYLMKSANIIEYDCNVPWRYGYMPIYDMRAMNFTTAIVWYNNCFDYILQIAFLAFGLFKNVHQYKEDMTFEETLRLCTFKIFRILLKEYPDVVELGRLWNIINTCHESLSELNSWANYAKHKGGIGYIGLKPKAPFQILVESSKGVIESRTSEFEPIKLDMDLNIDTVVSAHKALCKCIEDLVDFINFEGAKYRIDENGNFEIPDRSTYVKVNLS